MGTENRVVPKCPKCGKTETVRFKTRSYEYFHVDAYEPDNALVFLGDLDESYEDHEFESLFHCGPCAHEWPMKKKEDDDGG